MKRENIQQHLESDKPYKSRNEKKIMIKEREPK